MKRPVSISRNERTCHLIPSRLFELDDSGAFAPKSDWLMTGHGATKISASRIAVTIVVADARGRARQYREEQLRPVECRDLDFFFHEENPTLA